MTNYSDLLIVIAELDALERGVRPLRAPSELRAICHRLLAQNGEEELARQLLDWIGPAPHDGAAESPGLRWLTRLRKPFGRCDASRRGGRLS